MEKTTTTPSMFTPEQIAEVLAQLEENPDLVMKMIISGGLFGNEEDLGFMLESGRAFWTNVEKGARNVT